MTLMCHRDVMIMVCRFALTVPGGSNLIMWLPPRPSFGMVSGLQDLESKYVPLSRMGQTAVTSEPSTTRNKEEVMKMVASMDRAIDCGCRAIFPAKIMSFSRRGE